jgi:Ubiquitin family
MANASARVKKENNATSIIHGNAIDLKAFGIRPSTIFYHQEDQTSKVQFFVKHQSQTSTVSMERSDTILHVKEKIAQDMRIPAREQRLVYNGSELRDNVRLSALQPEATFHLALRLVGGMEGGSPDQRTTKPKMDELLEYMANLYAENNNQFPQFLSRSLAIGSDSVSYNELIRERAGDFDAERGREGNGGNADQA